MLKVYELQCEIIYFEICVTSKDSDLPAHPCSLTIVCHLSEETLDPWLSKECSVNPFSPTDWTDTYANSVDPDDMAHNEPSHLDIHCLPSC